MTWGNQKWVGAIPSFVARARRIKSWLSDRDGKEVVFRVRILGKIIRREAKAWAMKYLMADSEDLGEEFVRRRGMNTIKLISKPTHATIQEEDEMTIRVLRVRARTKEEE